MAFIKTLKFLNGISTEIDVANDSLVAKSIKIGGSSGTELGKVNLDTLISGLADASSLHSHNSLYYLQSQFISTTAGVADAGKPIKANGAGRIDSAFLNYASFASHSNLSNLNSDDHAQYHNDIRGDLRYYQKSEFISSSSGVADGDKPVKTMPSGVLDSSLISSVSVTHNSTSGLQGGNIGEFYHLTNNQHSTLTGSVDASTLHNHNTQYYTKSQIDLSLGTKADSSSVMLLNGTQAMAADMNLGGNKIVNLAAPSSSSDAARKQDVDDLSAVVFKKDGSVVATGNFNLNSFKITGLGNPTAGTDAVNKNYVDNLTTNVSWRKPVRTINITSTSLPTGASYIYDGVTHSDGDRVLFTALSNPSDNNKVYKISGVGSSISWAVETDGQAGNGSPTDGDAIYVQEGSSNGDSQWNYNGTSFVQFSGAGQVQAGVGLTKAGNTLSVALGGGIAELPTGEVGVDVRPNSGLWLTEDGTSPSNATGSQLAVKLNGSTLDLSSGGIKVSDLGIDTGQITDLAVTTAKINGNAVTDTKLSSSASVDANRAVGADHIKSSAVTTDKIAANAVDENKIASSVAGSGLTGGAGIALSVNVDNTTLEISSNQVKIKDNAITKVKIADDAVGSAEIDFGTGVGQVSAFDLPILDTANRLAATEVEAAITEIANSQMVREEVSGEAISSGDLVVLRRNSSYELRAYKASAANSSNQIYASSIVQDLTYTSKEYSGNDILISYIDVAIPNQPLNVSVSGKTISVYLATDGSSAVTSTASDIKTAIEGNSSANALVSITVSGNGSAIQSGGIGYLLSGGASYSDNGRWEVYGMAMDTAGSSGSTIRIRISGKLACNFVSSPSYFDIGKSVFLSINSGLATIVPPSSPGDSIVFLGRLMSTTEVDFRYPVLRGVMSS